MACAFQPRAPQRYAACSQLVGQALGISCGAALAVGWQRGREDGIFALWAGLALAMALAAALQATLLCRHDWNRSVAEAAARLLHDRRTATGGMGAHAVPLVAAGAAACAEPGACAAPDEPAERLLDFRVDAAVNTTSSRV